MPIWGGSREGQSRSPFAIGHAKRAQTLADRGPLAPHRLNRNSSESTTIRRPNRAAPMKKTGPRANREIEATTVQLIDESGENRGPTPTREALALAQESGLDLVEIVPTAKPPVCKILDLGRLKYETQKKQAATRKRQKTVEIKEIKMRPNIGDHDYDVKMRSVDKFLEEGDKVKFTMRFRGREMAHQERGLEVLHRVKGDVADRTKVEAEPKLEGRQMTMVVAPK